MFVTNPTFEDVLPRNLGEPGHRYWLAVLLSSETPWFLVTFRQEVAGLELLQTVAVAWETTLVTVVQTLTRGKVISVSRVSPTRKSTWVMGRVAELWLPAKTEADQTGPLLYRMAEESSLRDAFQNAVEREDSGRRLLFRAEE